MRAQPAVRNVCGALIYLCKVKEGKAALKKEGVKNELKRHKRRMEDVDERTAGIVDRLMDRI